MAQQQQPKAVLIFLSKRGCPHCDKFALEWDKIKAAIKSNNIPVITRYYIFDKINNIYLPAPLSSLDAFFPMPILVPYQSYISSFELSSDEKDKVRLGGPMITDALIFNGTSKLYEGKQIVEYDRPNVKPFTAENIIAWTNSKIATQNSFPVTAPVMGEEQKRQAII